MMVNGLYALVINVYDDLPNCTIFIGFEINQNQGQTPYLSDQIVLWLHPHNKEFSPVFNKLWPVISMVQVLVLILLFSLCLS